MTVAVLCQHTNSKYIWLATVAACCSQEQGAHASRYLADVELLGVLSAVHVTVYLLRSAGDMLYEGDMEQYLHDCSCSQPVGMRQAPTAWSQS